MRVTCDVCEGRCCHDVSDRVFDDGDLPAEYEVEGSSVFVDCSDCGGRGEVEVGVMDDGREAA